MGDYLDKMIPKVSVPEGTKGDWSVKRVEVGDFIGSFRERHFKPGLYTQLHHARRGLIMSDTPAERYDHLDFVRNATGDVLISGLGLGMCLGAVLLKPEVTSVTVLEIAPEVIDLIAASYCDPRVNIVQTDARSWKPPRGARFGAVWHDIWDNVCSDNLPEMATLNRRYARKAGWKGCWSQYLIRRQA